MSILQFETLLADGIIHLPDDISNQVVDGTLVRVSIDARSTKTSATAPYQ